MTISLVIVVFLHLVVTILHGAAHVGAAVLLGPAAMAFVIGVIQLGPLGGLLCARVRPAAGAFMVAATMAASLLFGLINHFVLPGTDHVAHVIGPWQPMFGWTAVLLALTEAAGVALGLWSGVCAIRNDGVRVHGRIRQRLSHMR